MMENRLGRRSVKGEGAASSRLFYPDSSPPSHESSLNLKYGQLGERAEKLGRGLPRSSIPGMARWSLRSKKGDPSTLCLFVFGAHQIPSVSGGSRVRGGESSRRMTEDGGSIAVFCSHPVSGRVEFPKRALSPSGQHQWPQYEGHEVRTVTV